MAQVAVNDEKPLSDSITRETTSGLSSFPGFASVFKSMSEHPRNTSLTTTEQTANHPHKQNSPMTSESSDLERLERLKKEILDGQNPIYKAVPQPDYLESLYLGRLVQKSKAPCQPDQVQDSTEGREAERSAQEVVEETKTVEKEKNGSPMPRFQMSDIMALSSKVRTPNVANPSRS